MTKIDRVGNATDSFTDFAGNLTDVYQPAVAFTNTGTNSSGVAVVTSTSTSNQRPHWQYGFDINGNQITQTDALGRVTSFAYDDHGRRLSRMLPGDVSTPQKTETWAYDTLGRQTVHVDFKNQTSVEVYDTNAAHGGRLTAEYRFNASNAANVFNGSGVLLTGNSAEHSSFGYDSLGRQNSVSEFTGTSSNPTRTETATFDPITGGVASVTTPEGTVNHSYDPATGRLTRTWTGAAGSTPTEDISYGYDGLGRLQSAAASIITASCFGDDLPSASYSYDGDGNLASVTTAGGTKTSFFYNGLGRLKDETITAPKTGGGTYTAADYAYTTRPDGLRSSVTEKVWRPTDAPSSPFSNVAITWTYDALGRLIGETRADQITSSDPNNYTAAYFLDLANNRTKYTITKPNDSSHNDTVLYANNARDELIAESSQLSGATTSYQYDFNGSLKSKQLGTNPADTYVWDLRNRMSSATVVGVLTSYVYDSSGFRVCLGPAQPHVQRHRRRRPHELRL
jgi:YD repeat-containing protein